MKETKLWNLIYIVGKSSTVIVEGEPWAICQSEENRLSRLENYRLGKFKKRFHSVKKP